VIGEKAFFLRSGSKPVFAVLYSGSSGDEPGGEGIVICDSLFEEKFWCERVCANMGRYLAGKGFSVLSFDYFGYGNSAGDSESVTVESLVDDISFACDFLWSRGVSSISLVGVRWGAALALEAASRRGDISQVFLVEPIVSWKKELLKALRANVAGQYAIFKKAVMTREEIIERLLSGEDCSYEGYRMNNIDGYIISRGFYEQAREIDLASWEGKVPSDVVIFETGAGKEGAPTRFEALCSHLGEKARSCSTAVLPDVNPFWTNYRVFTSTAGELYREIESFLRREIDVEGDAAGAGGDGWEGGSAARNGEANHAGDDYNESESIVYDGVREKIVTMESDEGHLMYGVLYSPESGGDRDLAVAFTHGGLIGMNGAFRFNTRAARRFAAEGIVSLCFDPHGMGRAQGRIENIDQRVLFRKIQSGLFSADVRKAADFLKENFPGKRVTVFGVCGGAITNIIAHGRYESIDSSVLLSIPVMLSGLSHEAVRMSGGYARFYLGMYVRKIFNPVAWLRFITFRSEYKKIFTALGVFITSTFKKMFSARRVSSVGKGKGKVQESPAGEVSIIKKTSAVTGSSLEFNEHFLAAYRAIVARRSPTLLVFGENDNFKWEFYSEFVEKFPDDWKAGEDVVSVEIIPHANHMYTLREWQDKIVDICIDWMKKIQHV